MKYKEVIETAPKTLVVNLFGTPVAGKSTGAAYIFSELKMRGINAELVTGFAKDKVVLCQDLVQVKMRFSSS